MKVVDRLMPWRNLWWLPRWKVPSFLMLHSVSDEIVDPCCPNNTVRPKELRDLILALRKDGYTFKTFKDAIETGDRWTMCLTFDDGYVDNYPLSHPSPDNSARNANLEKRTSCDKRQVEVVSRQTYSTLRYSKLNRIALCVHAYFIGVIPS